MTNFHRAASLLLILISVAIPLCAAELRGLVTDMDDRPIAGATVTARIGDRSVQCRSSSSGGFVLTLEGAVELPVALSFAAEGYATHIVVVEALGTGVSVQLAESPIFSGEVEITGTRATVGETPVTVTNIGRAEIERGYWGQDVPMFLSQVPGFNATNDSGNGVGYSYFTLRGFDMRRTAVSLNGVPLNDAHSHSVFFIDLADFLATTGDIQVQRGVGTSLYGTSAIGGSLDLRTRTPLPDRRLRLSTTNGSWGTHRFGLEFDTGLIDESWAATFRYSRIESEGYRDQSWVDMWNYFAAIEHYGATSTTRIVLFGGPEDTHLAYEGISKPYLDGEITGDRRRDRRTNPLTYANEIDHFFQPHYQLHNTWQISPTTVLNNSFYYFEGNGFFEQYQSGAWLPEYNFTPFPGPDGGLVETTDLVTRREVDEWDGGWIPQVDWRHGGGRGMLQAGVSIRLHSGRHFGVTKWAQDVPPGTGPNHPYYDYRLDKTSIQPFVQETWRFNSQWILLAGLSWNSHTYRMEDDKLKGVDFDESFEFLLPRLGVTFAPRDQWSFFVNVSRGGREPAFRDIYDPQYAFSGDPLNLEPEDLTDLELGGRHEWSTGFAALNLYWLDFDNAIVWAGGLDNNGEPVTANGAVVDQKGVELEFAWTPLPRWGGRLAVAYNDATFTDFVEYDWVGGAIDYSGNRLANNPEWLANLQLTGGFGPVDLLLSLRHVSEFYLDNTEDMRKDPIASDDPGYVHRVNPAYTVVDLALTADLGRKVADLISAAKVTIDLRCNNLTDELYTTSGYVWPEPLWIPAATRSTYLGIVIDW